MHARDRRCRRVPPRLVCWGLGIGIALLGGRSASAQAAQPSQTLAMDARGLGLGSAFAAVAVGPFATTWNPGGLAQERALSVCPFSYRQLLPSFDSDVAVYGAGLVTALQPLAVGLVYSRLDYGTAEGTGEASNEWNLHVGIGVDLARHVLHAPENVFWGVGGAYKFAHANLAPTFAVLGTARVGSGWDVDLGTLFTIRTPSTESPTAVASWGFRVAVNAVNLLQREMDFDAESSDFESSLHFGMAADVATAPVPPFAGGARVLVGFESVTFVGAASDDPTEYRFGIETTLLDLASVRLGYTGSDRLYEHATYGFSLGGPKSWLRLDFASVPGSGRIEHYALVVFVPY